MPDPPQKRARKPRAITPLLRDAAPLIMLASALFYTNRWFTLTEDEASFLSAAAQNVSTIFAAARSSMGNAHPPLFEWLLNLWLWITGGAFDALRAPSIICFVIGLWLLSRVARQLGGEESGNALVWLGALWPFGFHAGRLAQPSTFAFLLIAAITWQYFRCIRSRLLSHWITFCVLALALLYTNDFGWALLILLGVDYGWRIPEAKIDGPTDAPESARPPSRRETEEILVTAAVLVIGFAPRWPTLVRELHAHLAWPHFGRFPLLDTAYHFYLLFVSQSVAPWFWRFSIPAVLGILVLLVFVFAGIRGEGRRFLFFSILLFALLASAGILQAKWLLLAGAWFLLPTAMALGTIEKWQWRVPMALAMAAVAAIGWYGTLNRRYYADSRLLEPWASVADDAAQTIQSGSGVIGNNEAFFFYLTYALKPGYANSSWRFTGVLPRQAQYPSVWDPKQWVNAGRPKPATVLWIRGSSPPDDLAAMNDEGDWLSRECGDRITRYLARDLAYSWKQRFVPNFSGPAWLIEIRQYFCGQNGAPGPSGVPAPSGSH
jgi:Dolichyl-phosphate-mannose-protein mannosyltransferase